MFLGVSTTCFSATEPRLRVRLFVRRPTGSELKVKLVVYQPTRLPLKAGVPKMSLWPRCKCFLLQKACKIDRLYFFTQRSFPKSRPLVEKLHLGGRCEVRKRVEDIYCGKIALCFVQGLPNLPRKPFDIEWFLDELTTTTIQ
jgi:hypothetical protein